LRYYDIIITDAESGKVVQEFTSYQNGRNIAGALDVQFDIPVTGYAMPGDGAPWIRIWGIPLSLMTQAVNLVGNRIQVFGGMQKGLPLATPSQNGLLVEGFVLQAFGNWEANVMTLDIIIAITAAKNLAINTKANNAIDPDVSDLGVPNIVWQWKKGDELSTAITNVLQTAYPGSTIDVQIKSGIKLSESQIGFYYDLSELAGLIKQWSIDIVGGEGKDYQGVDIAVQSNSGKLTFKVRDGTSSINNPSSNAKQINFRDMIGQPTWINNPYLSIKLVMRADISVNDFIQLPNGVLPITTPQASSNQRDLSSFKGIMYVASVRHIGHFRQPTGDAWVTVIEAWAATEFQTTGNG